MAAAPMAAPTAMPMNAAPVMAAPSASPVMAAAAPGAGQPLATNPAAMQPQVAPGTANNAAMQGGQMPMQGGNAPPGEESRREELRNLFHDKDDQDPTDKSNDGTDVGGEGPGAKRAAFIMGVGVPVTMLLGVGVFIQMQVSKKPQIDDLGGDSEEALEDSDLADLSSGKS